MLCYMRDNLYFRVNITLYSKVFMRENITSHEARKVDKS